ncbi:hypothetical protein PIB30_025875 [Stylosanthes scabra]|uniref:Uncharacterized protein n=1 Tax=Stylosanthes scabra TaxID=79078 RepID=A0ABU6X8A8_9FABA|nr:hypothetical protein [Stylosanthes scabra]
MRQGSELRKFIEKSVYENIDGGKKKALEDGEVVIQSSKYGISDTWYRYLLLGIDTYNPQGSNLFITPRPSPSMNQA